MRFQTLFAVASQRPASQSCDKLFPFCEIFKRFHPFRNFVSQRDEKRALTQARVGKYKVTKSLHHHHHNLLHFSFLHFIESSYLLHNGYLIQVKRFIFAPNEENCALDLEMLWREVWREVGWVRKRLGKSSKIASARIFHICKPNRCKQPKRLSLNRERKSLKSFL